MNKKTKQVIDCHEKTQFTRIGLGLAGIAVNDATAELVWRTLKRIDEKKGQFSVTDGVELEFFIKKKYGKKNERVSTDKK
jgi:hypothetical protein